MKIEKLLLKHVLRNHIYYSIWRLVHLTIGQKKRCRIIFHEYFTTSYEGCEFKYNVNEDDMVCIPHDMSIVLESLDDLMIFRRF
jgi:serine acetyltransferase